MLVLESGPGAKQQVADFKHGAVWPLLVASYAGLRAAAPQLAGTADLLICDEGHRRAWKPAPEHPYFRVTKPAQTDVQAVHTKEGSS